MRQNEKHEILFHKTIHPFAYYLISYNSHQKNRINAKPLIPTDNLHIR